MTEFIASQMTLLLHKVKHRNTLPSSGEHYIQSLLEIDYAVTNPALWKWFSRAFFLL